MEGRFYNTGYFVDVYEHQSGSASHYALPIERQAGAGGDFRIVNGFVDAIRNGKEPLTSGKNSLYSHLIAFAAIKSVETGQSQKISY